jgi:hypothetical protein
MPLAGIQAEQQSLNGIDASGSPTNLMAYTALHTATPGTTGTSEGAWARQATSWNAATAAQPSHKTNSGALSFSGTSATYTHVGQWSAVTAGTFGIGAALTSTVTAASISIAAGALDYTSS